MSSMAAFGRIFLLKRKKTKKSEWIKKFLFKCYFTPHSSRATLNDDTITSVTQHKCFEKEWEEAMNERNYNFIKM